MLVLTYSVQVLAQMQWGGGGTTHPVEYNTENQCDRNDVIEDDYIGL